jgi:hypothetical protein
MTAGGHLLAAPAGAGPWVLLSLVVGLVVIAVVLLGLLRRRLLRPMPRRPSDTTDSWTEAGRRLQVPPPDEDQPGSGGEKP